MKNNSGYIVLAYASLFCYGLLDNIRGPAYPAIVESFNLDQTVGSLVFAIASVAALIALLTGRLWLKTIGEFKGQLLFNLFISFGFMIMGISGLWSGGYPIMLAGCAVLGLGLGGSMIATNVLIAFGSETHNRRRIYAGLHSMYGLAAILAPVIFGLALQSKIKWQYLFVALSILPLLVLTFGLKGHQIAHEWEQTEKPLDANFLKRLKIGLILAFYVSAEVAISTRLVLYVTQTKETSVAQASNYLSIFFILFLIGRLMFSIFKFPWSSFSLMRFSLVTSLIFFPLGILIHPLFMVICGITMSFYFPCGMDFISKRFSKNAGFMLISVTIAVDLILIIMHWGIGIATDFFGIKAAMMIGPFFLLLALILLVSSRDEFDYES